MAVSESRTGVSVGAAALVSDVGGGSPQLKNARVDARASTIPTVLLHLVATGNPLPGLGFGYSPQSPRPR